MLSEIAPVVSVSASRLTWRDARMTRLSALSRGAAVRAVGLVEEEHEALLGAGDVDDGVEHRLEQLVEVLHRHQLLAELVELADAGELRGVGLAGARLADGGACGALDVGAGAPRTSPAATGRAARRRC